MEDSNTTDIHDIYGQNFNLLYDLPEWFKCVVILLACVSVPLSLLAIFTLYRTVQEDQAAPIYLINLLVSDLVQISSSIISFFGDGHIDMFIVIVSMINCVGLLASVGFMVCIAVERYLLVAFPLWYRFRRNIRNSVIVSFVVWVLCVIMLILAVMIPEVIVLLFIMVLLLPFPVLIFSLTGTLKALMASIAMSQQEKLKIMAVLVLVLLNYTVLFLPFIIVLLLALQGSVTFSHLMVCMILFQLSPLVDLILYIFMKKGAFTKLQLNLRCCKKTATDQQSATNAKNLAVGEEGEEGAEPGTHSA